VLEVLTYLLIHDDQSLKVNKWNVGWSNVSKFCTQGNSLNYLTYPSKLWRLNL